ncbi:hypothetical protein BB8028_0001g10650 [Beauveria bassiana]|uniref:Uncharacterized protein n=1 Tax=Beauveria bassiana TaxID=176275 RepID=A0A2S7XYU6_BEABA|nr:hypothetical protein BB8028_0001g10650 [Beauveria bassiana]
MLWIENTKVLHSPTILTTSSLTMPSCPTQPSATGGRPQPVSGEQFITINTGPPPTAMPAPGETAQQKAWQNSEPSHTAKVAEVRQLQERRSVITEWQREREGTWPP